MSNVKIVPFKNSEKWKTPPPVKVPNHAEFLQAVYETGGMNEYDPMEERFAEDDEYQKWVENHIVIRNYLLANGFRDGK